MTVIASVAAGSATRKSGKYRLRGASSTSRPSSTSCMMSVAFNVFVIEPMCSTVSVVIGTWVLTLATPAAACSSCPFRKTATLAPGTWYFSSAALRRPSRSDCAGWGRTRGAGDAALAGTGDRATSASALAAPNAPSLSSSSRRFIEPPCEWE